jgi:Phytanoyl-CoA dioxygenase (PhyH)
MTSPAIRANPLRQPSGTRSPLWLRTLRKQPGLYGAICRARLFYSRRIAGAESRRSFCRNRSLLVPGVFERSKVESLRTHGYALLPEYFPADLVDRIYSKADAMFRNLQIDLTHAYSIQTGERRSLEGLSYENIAASEKMIALSDPLIHIPELLPLVFDAGVLRIAANFLGYIPSLYRVTVVRDFPHTRPLHSSNFHKDNDESDSLQIFIYLVDIDDTRGPLVYIPGSNHYDARSCRPRLSRDLGIGANDGRLSDDEVEGVYPRGGWAVLRTKRGSVVAIHGNGIHKGPSWPRPSDPNNRPRTAIKLDLHGHKLGVRRDGKENRIQKCHFDRMTELQRLFAHAEILESETGAAHAAAN